MFDIHTHIIFGVDDGARTAEEGLELIRMDVSQGVTDILATSHYYVKYPSHPEKLKRRLEELERQRKEAEKQGKELPVRLHLGNEVLWFESMPEKLKEGEILTLAGSRFTLVEFYPEESYDTIVRAVRKLRNAGYRPVIAHAERFLALRKPGEVRGGRRESRLADLIERGAYIQLSTQPFGGGFFDSTAKFVKDAVRNGEVHFLGTDMHRPDRRPPEWAAAVRFVRAKAEDPEGILQRNAERMLKDEDFLFR